MKSKRNLERAVKLISRSRYMVSLTGAGISTPSGIPDFRSPHCGLWENADPLLVASIYGFRRNPQAFYDWIAPLVSAIVAAQPNLAHIALAELEAAGRLKAVITQNIDGLHQRAGSQRVLELHGHLREAVCTRCRKVFPTEGLLAGLLQSPTTPRCRACGGILKPSVVLYGELLPPSVVREAELEAVKCDLMLVAGSSLEVAPACDLPTIAKQSGAHLIIVNYQPTPLDRIADLIIHDDVAVILPALVNGLRQVDGLTASLSP